MKKLLCILLSTLMILCVLPFSAFAEQKKEVIIVSPQTTTKIVLPDAPTAQESYAAETLQFYIEEITGIRPAIVSFGEKGFWHAIYVGDIEKNSTASEGSYTIREKDGSIFILGGGKRGTIYGMYAFLEKLCGCRWIAYDMEVVPKSETIRVEKDLFLSYTPCFDYTETDWRMPDNISHKIALGLNGGVYGKIPDEWGGSVGYISQFGHSLSLQFCSAKRYFDSHPEYFALRDGKRVPDQLCLTNPDVLKIVTDEALALCDEKHDPSQALQLLSISQNDNKNYCTCENCKVLDEENGSQSGTLLTFVNAVARAVKAAGYDNIVVETFAYQYTRKPPEKVVPEDNVMIRLCSIECCFGHTLDDPKCPENVSFMENLKEWAKISDRLCIWDYTTNYRETYNIFPDFGTLQRNMQIFYENNVKGVYEEGAYYIDSCDGEFADLRMYLIAKLMQDPYMDYDAEMNDFLQAYYGGGWKEIREFLDICTRHAVTNTRHLGIGQYATESLPLMTDKEIRHCDSLWAAAEAMAGSEKQLQNVRQSKICWRYWKCSNRKQEFGPDVSLHTRMANQEALYNDMVAFGGVRLGEDSRRLFTENKGSILLRLPFNWQVGSESKFFTAADGLILKLYRQLSTQEGENSVFALMLNTLLLIIDKLYVLFRK